MTFGPPDTWPDDADGVVVLGYMRRDLSMATRWSFITGETDGIEVDANELTDADSMEVLTALVLSQIMDRIGASSMSELASYAAANGEGALSMVFTELVGATLTGRAEAAEVRCPACGRRLFGPIAVRGACNDCFPPVPGD